MVGKTVELRVGGRSVATAVVGSDGTFAGQAPPAAGPSLRYVATVGTYRSSPVTPTPQVTARMRRTAGDTLRVSGRVRSEGRGTLTATLIGRADACAARTLEREVAVRPDGTFVLTASPAPAGLYRVVIRRNGNVVMSSPFQRIDGAAPVG
ncbi:MAG: hypothetical protein JHD16_18685 [Solirubrobacteraceae bacterium]|nr:hypothetical protein [Solirubrobacteraceae bacterium]